MYRVSTDTPGVSTKLNPPINKAAEAIESMKSDFFSGGAISRGRVFYTLRTIATGTLDVYVVDLDNPGVATQVNPDLGDGREVGTFVVTPDGNNLVYAAQLNSDADELFITSFANPGVATKLDGPSARGRRRDRQTDGQPRRRQGRLRARAEHRRPDR